MVAYVVGSVYMFRTGHLLFTSRAAGWVAALAFMLNPSVLYMQSTPMTEVELISAAIVAVYYLLRWARTYHPFDLFLAAGVVAAATLVRYDGWVLMGASAIVVAYIAWRRHERVGAEACSILFGALAFAGSAAGSVNYCWVDLLWRRKVKAWRG